MKKKANEKNNNANTQRIMQNKGYIYTKNAKNPKNVKQCK